MVTMLTNSTPGVNFTNLLRAAFALVDPESVKIQLSHQCLFMLLESASIKVVRRTLMKLSPVFLFEATNCSSGAVTKFEGLS